MARRPDPNGARGDRFGVKLVFVVHPAFDLPRSLAGTPCRNGLESLSASMLPSRISTARDRTASSNAFQDISAGNHEGEFPEHGAGVCWQSPSGRGAEVAKDETKRTALSRLRRISSSPQSRMSLRRLRRWIACRFASVGRHGLCRRLPASRSGRQSALWRSRRTSGNVSGPAASTRAPRSRLRRE